MTSLDRRLTAGRHLSPERATLAAAFLANHSPRVMLAWLIYDVAMLTAVGVTALSGLSTAAAVLVAVSITCSVLAGPHSCRREAQADLEVVEECEVADVAAHNRVVHARALRVLQVVAVLLLGVLWLFPSTALPMMALLALISENQVRRLHAHRVARRVLVEATSQRWFPQWEQERASKLIWIQQVLAAEESEAVRESSPARLLDHQG